MSAAAAEPPALRASGAVAALLPGLRRQQRGVDAASTPFPMTGWPAGRPARGRRAARSALLAAALGAVPWAPAAAQDDGGFKLTLGRYRLAGGGAPATLGTDLNLRYRRADQSLWLGHYRDAAFGQQWRAGWDAAWPLGGHGDALALQALPSLQWAGGGFVGGSLALQAGAPFYAQLGIGRTNLRRYANLNFDPNDALTAALGWQGEGGRQLALSVIADDRLGTGQQHHHLTLRWPLPAGVRLAADLLHKQGQGDGGAVRAWGWSLGLDGSGAFLRLARDPKQNFSVQDAWRLSGGWRF